MKFAVVIPTYNSELTITETLTSIIHQHRKADEIIVVDDGSMDNTIDAVRSFPHVKCISKNNSGVSDSRNIGVKHSNCDWIALCDSDDVWSPEKLEVVEAALNVLPENCGFIFHGFNLFGSDIADSGHYTSYKKNSVFSIFKENDINIYNIFTNNISIKRINTHYVKKFGVYYGNVFKWLILGNFILPSTVMINKKLFLSNNGFDVNFKVAEETEFFLRLSKYSDFAYIDRSLAKYRWERSGLTADLPKLMHSGMNALYKNTVEDLNVYKKYRDYIRIGISKRFSRASYYWLTELNLNYAAKFAKYSIKYNRNQVKAFLILFFTNFPINLLKLFAIIKSKLRIF